jgi:hypothetical protein
MPLCFAHKKAAPGRAQHGFSSQRNRSVCTGGAGRGRRGAGLVVVAAVGSDDYGAEQGCAADHVERSHLAQRLHCGALRTRHRGLGRRRRGGRRGGLSKRRTHQARCQKRNDHFLHV